MSEVRIGVSGWSYPEWRGAFYPKGLIQKRELEYASRPMNSIEINGSFYSLQTPASYKKWAAATPDDFVFSLKGSKYITHNKKLRDVRVPLANFFASGLLLLGEKLGPILWQFPPWLQFDPETINDFLDLLPGTAADAAVLSRENTIRSNEKRSTEAIAGTKLRYAFEPRHESFFSAEFIELLRGRNAALTISDTGGKWPYAEDITADFLYIRLHGEALYTSDYSDTVLDGWARRIKAWQKGGELSGAKKITKKKPPKRARDIYVYFDNSIAGHAPFDAVQLADRTRRRR
jgi:uncharacterized protein YecE (DUF72 family)